MYAAPNVAAVQADALSDHGFMSPLRLDEAQLPRRPRPGAGDAKYWVQAHFAHQLLMDSTSAELSLWEQQQQTPDAWDALQAMESDRLSAIAMLSVLDDLVARMDSERAPRGASRSPSPKAHAAVKRGAECAPTAVAEAVAAVAAASTPSPVTPPRLALPGESAVAPTPLKAQKRPRRSALPQHAVHLGGCASGATCSPADASSSLGPLSSVAMERDGWA